MVPVLVLVLIIGAVVAVKIAAKRLRDNIDGWHREADARGYRLDLTHRAPPALPFDLFNRVSDKKAWTTVTQPDSNDSAFLYKFDVRTGDVEEKFRRTCALVELPFDAPKTTLRPRPRQSVPAQPTDGADLLIGHTAFDQALRLQATDDTFAARLFDDDMAMWLLTADAKAGSVEFELRDRWLLCAGPRTEDIDDLIDFLEWAQRLRDRLTPAGQRLSSSSD